ncbi:Serine/threonine-protein kinase PSK2 [Cyberlindnera fabianii]|uniref:Serine/threonine-protein kinase PSK2 n=1 Tax=Cyberlindnera fabianii TaxID=36022 RepID=A0A1V2LDU7_CYBFA|nr:Serine/threonine-protein kinase PSK2 [Cyberlindnera fabianii]
MPYACPINGKGAALNISNSPSRAGSISPQPTNTELPEQTSSLGGVNGHCTTSKSNPVPSLTINRPAKSNNETKTANQLSSATGPTVLAPNPFKGGAKMFDMYNDEDESPSVPPRAASVSPSRRPQSQPSTSPLRRSNSRKKAAIGGGISKLSLNLDEILKFPKESTHAYSYAHLSPNSLAVRLSILKRSLEILVDRPDLINGSGKGLQESTPLNLDIESFITQMQTEKTQEATPSSPSISKINIRSNASSAALAALFNNGMPQSPAPSHQASPIGSPVSTSFNTGTDHSAGMSLQSLIDLLQDDKLSDDKTSRQTLARNLHDLSLSTAVKEVDPESQLKTRLLYALATPFYEPIVQTPIISLNKGASTLALSSLNEQAAMASTSGISTASTGNNGNRIFHNISQKNISPQAVFTCELNDPWNLKAANDLACLIFGVSRKSLRRLTLLDLISPDSRDFVLNRLISNSISKSDIIFSGEIIAIAKSGNKLTWASLWAKKKGNLIICMFDQVPCDSVDLIVKMDDSFTIESYKTISGNNFFGQLATIKELDGLVTNISGTLNMKREENSSMIPRTILDSQTINDQRYFTLKKSGYKIPCAITSKVIDEDQAKVKMKIHTLPYIAGVFIISSSDYKLLSFNQSISKNLFGLGEKQLLNKSIDTIVPNFTRIMKFVLAHVQNLKVIPGLVLPEHFFRQMDAAVEGKGEQGFLKSIGINGRHADGSTIKIDVQLRCSNVDTLVLWITHSRTVYGSKLNPRVGFKEDTKAEDGKKSAVDDHFQTDDEAEEDAGDSVPSQLSILNENEIQSVSRSSSMRSTARSSTTVTSSSNVSSAKPSDVDIQALVSLPDSETPSTDVVNEYKPLDKDVDEDQLLQQENAAIERTKSISSRYPKTIGLKRREKSIREFNVLKKMGQGAYGRVVLAENKEDPLYKVVIKLIIKERILVDTWVRDRKLGTIPSEIQIMATLNKNPHPNIMRLIDFFEDEDYYYIETPPHGFPSPAIDLFDLIELKKDMSEFECKSIIKQSISAINHLHNNGVVHRDIKDENLIIDSKGVIKLIDFGSAAYTKKTVHSMFFVGTLDYAAPEVLNGQSYEGMPQDGVVLGYSALHFGL